MSAPVSDVVISAPVRIMGESVGSADVRTGTLHGAVRLCVCRRHAVESVCVELDPTCARLLAQRLLAEANDAERTRDA